jgi:hypothetical protein
LLAVALILPGVEETETQASGDSSEVIFEERDPAEESLSVDSAD